MSGLWFQQGADRQTATRARLVNYSGLLHSNEYRREVLADNVTAQVIRDEMRNLFLHINETPITQWFKEQFGLSQSQTRKKGFGL